MHRPTIPRHTSLPAPGIARSRCCGGADRTGGFSLIEVLVAFVLLAIGLLGAATLLLESLSGSRIALDRTRAVTLAGDMLERIRANRGAGNAYDTADGPAAPALDAGCEQADAGCDAEVMASHDLRRWLDTVADQLPQGRGAIDVAPLPEGGLRCIVRVSWARSGSAQAAVYALEAEL